MTDTTLNNANLQDTKEEKKGASLSPQQKAQETKKKQAELLTTLNEKLGFKFQSSLEAFEYLVNEKINLKKDAKQDLTLVEINNHPTIVKQTKLIFEQNAILQKQQNMIEILTQANLVAEKTVEILAEKLNLKANEIQSLVKNIETEEKIKENPKEEKESNNTEE